MRLPFRKKDKKKDDFLTPCANDFAYHTASLIPHSPPTRASTRLLAYFPPSILQRIFAFVCPHSTDESYETCEESANDQGCMLCDLRDLSHCAKVSQAWRASAVSLLYRSVRIDPVHYCQLEAFLAERRKKTSRFDRNGIPEDPALARLRLFRRTVRDDPTRLGKLVHFLKTPYMIRESYHVELAQTIAVLPNLHHVDLPEGMFADEPNYQTLRLEVQARCPGLRKMSYVHGAEHSFSMLVGGQVWPYLEVLELDRVDVDPLILRGALGSLIRLRALKVSDTPSFSDEMMATDDGLPPLPALDQLVLHNAPRMTSKGLVDYLSWYETQRSLQVLTLKDTGVEPDRLHEILAMGPSLSTVAIQCKISGPLQGTENLPPLASKSLRTLRFEISATSRAGPYATPGHYSYLASSILSGCLPRLLRLYVHDETFPGKLSGLPTLSPILAHRRNGSSSSNAAVPPMRAGFGSPSAAASTHVRAVSASPRSVASHTRAGSGGFGVSNTSPPALRVSPALRANQSHRLSATNPYAPRTIPPPPTQTLEVFTKSDEYGQWNFARVDSLPLPGMEAAAPRQRPVSTYGLAADVAGQGWDRGEARRSVMMGDGAGAFLLVPGSEGAGQREVGAMGLSPPRGFPPALRPHSIGGETSRTRAVWH